MLKHYMKYIINSFVLDSIEMIVTNCDHIVFRYPKENVLLFINSSKDNEELDLSDYGTLKTKRNVQDKQHLLSDSDQDSPSTTDLSWSGCICTNIFVIMTSFFHASGCITSQLTEANILQINCIRYLVMAVIGLSFAVSNNYSLGIRRPHIWKLLVCVILRLFGGTGFLFAASFMPLGTFGALQSAVGALLAAIYDFLKRKATFVSLLSAWIAIVGILLLSQPWRQTQSVKLAVIPCEYFQNTSQSVVQLSVNANAFNATEQPKGGLNHWFQTNQEIIGYTLTVTIPTVSVIRGVFLRELMKEYSIPSILYWHTIAETILHVIINMLWSQVFNVPFLNYPEGTVCIMAFVLLLLSAIISNTCSYYAFGRTNVSTSTIAEVVFAALLYVCQRTFLKEFHPGHANVIEIIGIVVIIVSVPSLRLVSFYMEHKKDEENPK